MSAAVIAHRGFAAEYPENTLTAFRAAARRADAIELDVRRCASGEPVVLHDATLDRVTDGAGRVAGRDLAALRELSVLDTGEPPPTLSAVLEAVPEDVGLHVECKTPGVVPAAERLLSGTAHDVVLSSFLPAALARARTLPTALLVARFPDRAVERASELGCAALHPHARMALETPVVSRAQGAGLAVNAWTLAPDCGTAASAGAVTAPEAPRRLRSRGVDGLIADCPC